MDCSGFKAVIVQKRKRNSIKSLLSIKCKVNKEQFSIMNSEVYGGVIFANKQLFGGIFELKNPGRANEDNLNVSVHLLTEDKDLIGNEVIVRGLFKVREVKNFSSQMDMERQLMQDIVTVKLHFGMENNFASNLLAIQLPDFMFTKLINECFGLNRGVYNTVELWFWSKGMSSIKKRRKEIIGFLIKHIELKNRKGKIKFGSGQLSKKLEQYWNEEVVAEQPIL